MRKIIELYTRFKRAAAMDFHIVATLFFRGWSIVAGIVTIIAVPMWFSTVEQGYYFTFASVLALQVFFELGLNFVLSQVVAAEMSKLHWCENDVLSGDESARQRLGSLVDTVSKVYLVLAIIFFIGVGTGGMYFFSASGHGEVPRWLLSWWLLVGITAGNLFCSPLLAIVEGTGKVGQVARLRMIQSVIGYSFAWVAMSAGLGLLAVPFISGSALLGSLYWLSREGRFLKDIKRKVHAENTPVARINWRLEILPFQWRIAVSWMSGYLIFQLFIPVIFTYYGPEEAGKIGLGLVMFGSLITLSMSWVNSKAPEIARLIGISKSQAHQLFKKQFIVSTTINVTLCIVLVLAVALGNALDVPRVDRLPNLSVLVCIAIVSIANQIVFSLAVFMRSHGEEPMLLPSIVTGLVTLAVVAVAGKHSIFLTMALYASVTTFLALPWTAKIFFARYWRV